MAPLFAAMRYLSSNEQPLFVLVIKHSSVESGIESRLHRCCALQHKVRLESSYARRWTKHKEETLGTVERNTQEKKEQRPSVQNPWAHRGCKPGSKLSLKTPSHWDLAGVSRKGTGGVKSSGPSQKPSLQSEFKRRRSTRQCRHDDRSWRPKSFILCM